MGELVETMTEVDHIDAAISLLEKQPVSYETTIAKDKLRKALKCLDNRVVNPNVVETEDEGSRDAAPPLDTNVEELEERIAP